LSSYSEGRSAAPSARSDGLDDVDGGPDCRVYIQVGGIEQDGVVRLPEWRGRAMHIPLVAAADVCEHIRFAEVASGGP